MLMTRGTRLGSYEIVGRSRRGMGEVYRRRTRASAASGAQAAARGICRDADRLARFEREARTVAALNHPNIVVLYSVEDESDVRFLTMELVEGQSLDRHVAPGAAVAQVLDLASRSRTP